MTTEINLELPHNHVGKIRQQIVNIDQRDILLVEIFNKDGALINTQPFYESTGGNSGNPNRWYPFDGVMALTNGKNWFVKDSYINTNFENSQPESRLGSPNFPEWVRDLFVEISNQLTTTELKRGVPKTRSEINLMLNTPITLDLEKRINPKNLETYLSGKELSQQIKIPIR